MTSQKKKKQKRNVCSFVPKHMQDNPKSKKPEII